MTSSEDEVLMFGEQTGYFPGLVYRIGHGVKWDEIRDAAFEKRRLSSEAENGANHHGFDAGVALSEHSTTSEVELANFSKLGIAESSANGSTTALNPKVKSSSSSSGPPSTSAEKLRVLLDESVVNLDVVKKLAWAGIPDRLRAPVWKILLAYEPTNLSRRKDTLLRRRREYREAVEQCYSPFYDSSDDTNLANASHIYSRPGNQEDTTMRQITVDLPRTCPKQALFHVPEVQLALQRILYVWATRHPASGYVQGMNDLVTPFVFVFLSEYAQAGAIMSILDTQNLDAIKGGECALASAEADAYWCLTALLNDIQDYYTFSQPGIQRRVHYLRELVARVDANLCSHLEDEGLNFLQFAFRWMNCLLMRELPFPLIVRLWDTYLAESEGFAVFHVYVCAALLVSFSDELQEMDFQDLVMFLQNLPTQAWTFKEIDMILSQAYMWRTIFGSAPRHLQ